MAHVADHPGVGLERPSRWSVRRARVAGHSVPFPELVHLHGLWRDALEGRGESLHDVDRRYHDARAAFEREHGEIVSEYWCSRVASGVVLTAEPETRFTPGRLVLYRASDWATENHQEIAALVHRCDELAARAGQVLTGVRERICMQLVMASASHLLSLAETDGDAKRLSAAIEQERHSLDDAETYYHDAATGQAQVVYFTGIAFSMAAIALFAVLGSRWVPLPEIDDREFYGCLAAGAIGAVVSVIQRINSGHFDLEYDVGRSYVRFLGALRPTIGAVFGLALYFAITSRILKLFELPAAGTTARVYALLVIAFLAGFSERWAQDTLTSLTPAGAPPAAAQVEPKRRRARNENE
jgi:hypothetical protein